MTTEIKYTVSMPAEDYDKLFKVLTWIDDAPSEDFGDTFYETVYDILTDLIPTFSDEVMNYTTYYTDCPCLVNGEACVPICSDDDGSEAYYIKLVKETVD